MPGRWYGGLEDKCKILGERARLETETGKFRAFVVGMSLFKRA